MNLNKILIILIGLLAWTSVSLSAQKDIKLKALTEELEIARRTNDYDDLALAYYNLALHDEDANRNLERSFEHLSRSLEYYELARDTVGINRTKYHIARQLLGNDMYDDAYNRITELKVYFDDKEDLEMQAYVDLLLFDYHMERLEVELAQVTLKNVKTHLSTLNERALQLEVISRDLEYNNLMQDYKRALDIANDCFAISAELNDTNKKANCLLARGMVYRQLQQYQLSIDDLQSALVILSPIPYSKERLMAYKLMAENHRTLELHEQAYRYAEKYSRLQDSILNENRILAINNLTYKYESKEKATEIKHLEQDKAYVQKSIQQQKRALIVLGLAMAGLILGIYYIIRFYSEKIKSAQIIEEQNEKISQQKITELRDKLQINSMESMIVGQEVERERIAKDLHDSLGGLLSTIKLRIGNLQDREANPERFYEYNQATKLLDVAVSEIRTISQDLQPGALKRLGLVSAINDLINRYQSSNGPEITFQHFGIPKELDQNFAMGIYRIVQEIFNNAIKHAKASEIFVQLNGEGDDIVIHIEDDGIGFDVNKKYKSMGLENIKSRVNYLQGTIDIDSRIGQGTSFIIHLNSQFRNVSPA